MQELKKILEEIKRIKDGNRKEKLYAKYPPDSKNQEVLNAYSQGYEDGTDNFYNAIAGIVRKHMNDGWIPVEERLPTREECEKSNNKFFVQSDNGEIFCCEYDTLANGYDDPLWSCNVPIIAWHPLPEKYC